MHANLTPSAHNHTTHTIHMTFRYRGRALIQFNLNRSFPRGRVGDGRRPFRLQGFQYRLTTILHCSAQSVHNTHTPRRAVLRIQYVQQSLGTEPRYRLFTFLKYSATGQTCLSKLFWGICLITNASERDGNCVQVKNVFACDCGYTNDKSLEN